MRRSRMPGPNLSIRKSWIREVNVSHRNIPRAVFARLVNSNMNEIPPKHGMRSAQGRWVKTAERIAQPCGLASFEHLYAVSVYRMNSNRQGPSFMSHSRVMNSSRFKRTRAASVHAAA